MKYGCRAAKTLRQIQGLTLNEEIQARGLRNRHRPVLMPQTEGDPFSSNFLTGRICSSRKAPEFQETPVTRTIIPHRYRHMDKGLGENLVRLPCMTGIFPAHSKGKQISEYKDWNNSQYKSHVLRQGWLHCNITTEGCSQV